MSGYRLSPQCDALLRSVYQGPLDDPLWHTFLTRLREAVAASFATLVLRPPREGEPGVVLNALIVSPEVLHSYSETYFAFDPFVDLPLGEVVTLKEFMPSEQLHQTEYYRQYMAPIGVDQIMGADITDESGLNARLRVTRGAGQPEFGEAEKSVIRMLLPHLSQAIGLYSRLERVETVRAVYEDAVDQLAVGTIILDERGHVIRINDAATELLDGDKGLAVVDGKLTVGNRHENQLFREVVEQVLQAHMRSEPTLVKAFRTEQAPGLMRLGMLIKPLPMNGSAGISSHPSVAVFISDPQQRRAVPKYILGELFGFTPAESSLALLLANGLTLDEASAELGISRNTAKSHLSAIFAKAGVTRQTKLVQLILKSVAPMSPEQTLEPPA